MEAASALGRNYSSPLSCGSRSATNSGQLLSHHSWQSTESHSHLSSPLPRCSPPATTSLVRPHLEYACPVWDPHLIKDKKLLEDVQKFGCKLAAHQWDSGYQELLDLFELPSLEQQRLHLKLGLMFKIIHRLCYFPDVPEFRTNIPDLRSRHPLQLEPPFAHSNAYKFSFFPHTSAAWNSLSNECVTSPTYKTFMKQLSSI